MVLMLRKLLLFKRKYARARAILSGFVVDQKQREIFFAFLRVLCLVLSLCLSLSVLLLLLYLNGGLDSSRAAARVYSCASSLKRELKLLLSQQRKIRSFFITMMSKEKKRLPPLTRKKKKKKKKKTTSFLFLFFSFLCFIGKKIFLGLV